MYHSPIARGLTALLKLLMAEYLKNYSEIEENHSFRQFVLFRCYASKFNTDFHAQCLPIEGSGSRSVRHLEHKVQGSFGGHLSTYLCQHVTT